jgi:hypothetical protein
LYAGTYGRGVWRVALGCAPTTCQPSQCGIISDGCGGSFDCGGCPSGSQCISNNYCCMPLTCASAGFTCGTLLDGCGHTLSCGGCPSGQACVDNTCCAHVRCFLGACHCLS